MQYNGATRNKLSESNEKCVSLTTPSEEATFSRLTVKGVSVGTDGAG